jgi:hypothetical protein
VSAGQGLRIWWRGCPSYPTPAARPPTPLQMLSGCSDTAVRLLAWVEWPHIRNFARWFAGGRARDGGSGLEAVTLAGR